MHAFLVTFKASPIFCHEVTYVAFECFSIVPICVISHASRSVGFIITNSTVQYSSILSLAFPFAGDDDSF